MLSGSMRRNTDRGGGGKNDVHRLDIGSSDYLPRRDDKMSSSSGRGSSSTKAPPPTSYNIFIASRRLLLIGITTFVVTAGLCLLGFGIYVQKKRSEQRAVIDEFGNRWRTLSGACLPAMSHTLHNTAALLLALDAIDISTSSPASSSSASSSSSGAIPDDGSNTTTTTTTADSSAWNSSLVGAVWASASTERDGLGRCSVVSLLVSRPGSFGLVDSVFEVGMSTATAAPAVFSGFSLATSVSSPSGAGGNLAPIVLNTWDLGSSDSNSLSGGGTVVDTATTSDSSTEFPPQYALITAYNVTTSRGIGFVGLLVSPPSFDSFYREATLVPHPDVDDPLWVLTATSTSTDASTGVTGTRDIASTYGVASSSSSSQPVVFFSSSLSDMDVLSMTLRPASNDQQWYSMDTPAITIIVLCAIGATIIVVSSLIFKAEYVGNSERAYTSPPVLAPLGILMASVRTDKTLWATWPQEMSETLRLFETIVRTTIMENESDYNLSVISQNGGYFSAVAGSPQEVMSAAEDLHRAISKARWPSQVVASGTGLPVRFVCNFSADVEVNFDSRRNAYDYRGRGLNQTRVFMLGVDNPNRVLLTEDFHSSFMLVDNSRSLRTVRVEQQIVGLGKVKYYYVSNLRRHQPLDMESLSDHPNSALFDNPMTVTGMTSISSAEAGAPKVALPKGAIRTSNNNGSKKQSVSRVDLLLLEKVYGEWKTPTDPPITNIPVSHSLKNAFIAYRMLLDPFPTEQRENLIRVMAIQFGLPHNSVLHRLAVHTTMVGGVYQEAAPAK